MDGWESLSYSLQVDSVWGKNSQNKSSRSFCPCLSKRVVAWPASLAFALVLPTLLGTECSRHRFSKQGHGFAAIVGYMSHGQYSLYG